MRPRQVLDLDIEAKLPPCGGDQLCGLEFLRVAGLGGAEQGNLADLVPPAFQESAENMRIA
ncbi:hypothetical protein [Roseomonas gilardii]|uniref:hypothetical protein n=1 Tax=Roseomonas gilardii TaxID=257708 RepID=UPI0012DCCA14|nr:hypothetical protein [Roseomonas gilardii]